MPHDRNQIVERLRDEVGLPKAASKRVAKKLETFAKSNTLFPGATRKKLPSERNSITHRFSVHGHMGLVTVGMYRDGTPGEVLIKLDKEGSILAGVLDGFSILFSIALEYGVPLRAITDKLVGMKFEPSGYTGNKEIHYAKSILDYVGRYLGGKFISPDYLDLGPTDASISSDKGSEQVSTRSSKATARAPHPHKPKT
jgi:ribonucleoside-diphosphate reductase alpha chain